ncbi:MULTISPECIES: 2OG-Fe(II) oxygenase [unclassified Thioalkalivibrio]|uniref:2OG-Fe(II) oxygenase n=1 Tax=unclassified Thioalkalivibrio TaxID=2621013 RepID=UPI0003664558|nr:MULTISPECIES: 2OG-Fe(II) oxygenase [unclassified Thioalkalivibrio]
MNLPALGPEWLEAAETAPTLAPVVADSSSEFCEPDGWLDALAHEHRLVWPDFLPQEIVDALREEVYALRDAAQLAQARIGRAGERHRDRATRGDWIHWLDGASPAQQAFMARLDEIRLQASRALIPGLFETESHFALYPPGTHYARHVDAFQAGNCRRLSLVFYLNRHWRERDGGQLAIYDSEGREIRRIQPRAGTLVMFLSQTVPHAVLPTRRWRASIASWMRIRDLSGPLASLASLDRF